MIETANYMGLGKNDFARVPFFRGGIKNALANRLVSSNC